MTEYAALTAARDIATKDAEAVRARLQAVVARAKSDGVIAPPLGFKYIDTAPLDGTYVRLRFRPGLGREHWEQVGQWRVMPDGFFGWWDRDGHVVTPGPLFWAPETGSVQ